MLGWTVLWSREQATIPTITMLLNHVTLVHTLFLSFLRIATIAVKYQHHKQLQSIVKASSEAAQLRAGSVFGP